MKLSATRGLAATAASCWSFSLSLHADYSNPEIVSDANVPKSVIDSFQKDGFAVFPKVLTPGDVNILNERLEYVLRGEYDRGTAPDKAPKRIKSPFDKTKNSALGFSGNTQNVKVLQVINVHKSDKAFRRLAIHPAIGKVVASLAGWDGARLGKCRRWGSDSTNRRLWPDF